MSEQRLLPYEPKPAAARAARLFDGSGLDLRLGSDGLLRLYKPQLLVALKPGDVLFMGPGFQRRDHPGGFDVRYARIDLVERHEKGWRLTVTWLWPEEAFDGRPEGTDLPRGGEPPVGQGIPGDGLNGEAPGLQAPGVPPDRGDVVRARRGEGSPATGAPGGPARAPMGGGATFEGPVPDDGSLDALIEREADLLVEELHEATERIRFRMGPEPGD